MNDDNNFSTNKSYSYNYERIKELENQLEDANEKLAMSGKDKDFQIIRLQSLLSPFYSCLMCFFVFKSSFTPTSTVLLFFMGILFCIATAAIMWLVSGLYAFLFYFYFKDSKLKKWQISIGIAFSSLVLAFFWFDVMNLIVGL